MNILGDISSIKHIRALLSYLNFVKTRAVFTFEKAYLAKASFGSKMAKLRLTCEDEHTASGYVLAYCANVNFISQVNYGGAFMALESVCNYIRNI